MLHFNAAAVKNNVKCHQRPHTNTAFGKQQAWLESSILFWSLWSEPNTSQWCCCKDNAAKDLPNLLNHSSENVQHSMSKVFDRKREKSVDKGGNV